MSRPRTRFIEAMMCDVCSWMQASRWFFHRRDRSRAPAFQPRPRALRHESRRRAGVPSHACFFVSCMHYTQHWRASRGSQQYQAVQHAGDAQVAAQVHVRARAGAIEVSSDTGRRALLRRVSSLAIVGVLAGPDAPGRTMPLRRLPRATRCGCLRSKPSETSSGREWVGSYWGDLVWVTTACAASPCSSRSPPSALDTRIRSRTRPRTMCSFPRCACC
jgi:hypothetical protein